MTGHRWLVAAVGLLVAASMVGVTGGRDASRAAAAPVAGTLRLSAEVAAPRSLVTARGRVASHSRRRVVLQRSVGGPWRRVDVGRSSRRGRYELVSRLPGASGIVVRYRVYLPQWRRGSRVLPRRFTSTDSLRTAGAPDTPLPSPTPAPAPVPPAPPSPPGPTADPTGPFVADWAMDEPAGSTTMVDRSGHGHHGAISADAAEAGLELHGSYYSWSDRCRDCPPVALPRVVQVPDSAELEIPDPAVPWTLELRFSTTAAYGNLMQKGQVTTPGGEIKVEDPAGLKCVFRGANGEHVIARSPQPLNDGAWHTVACVHTATSVSQWVDGVLVAETQARTGPIDNREPFVIGGKRLCDQQTVGCDYYSGLVDWARITRG